MNVLVFAASNNRQSINRSLAYSAATQVAGVNIDLLDIADYEMPLFSDEREQRLGQPALALAFHQKIAAADALVIGFAEHNGSYTAAWKNLVDWTSRIDKAVFQNKPAVFLATSPGPGGAAHVLQTAVDSAPHYGGNVRASLSVPSFQDNFDDNTGRVTNPALQYELLQAMLKLKNAVNQRRESSLQRMTA